jgi:hypothetical protein
MKIVGRILIILAVFALVMGITYGIVSSRSSAAPAFGLENERFSNQARPALSEWNRTS